MTLNTLLYRLRSRAQMKFLLQKAYPKKMRSAKLEIKKWKIHNVKTQSQKLTKWGWEKRL